MKKRFIFILCGLFLCVGTIAATDYNVLQQGVVGDGKTLIRSLCNRPLTHFMQKGAGNCTFLPDVT